jgi:urease accessory protein
MVLTPTHMRLRKKSSLPAPSLLQLMWLASPALPIGGFSYSEGIEAGVDIAYIATFSIANEWLIDQLHLSLARADLAVVAKAIPAWRRGDLERINELNDWVLQSRETSELRLQTEQMGRSMLDWLRKQPSFHTNFQEEQDFPKFSTAATSGFLKSPTYPLVFALAASSTQACVRDCLMSFAFGWAENMTQAAVRAVPLGQTDGQRILANLADHIPAAVDAAIKLQDSERQAFSPMLAILSSQHETQYSRLFRS